jgi:late competence protein required for DNA uptake (superfamily II DNA/RNA helicase)
MDNNIGKITFNEKGREIEFSPSKYQKDIFDFVEHGHGNLVIEAVAGAGKTTTIINCLKLIPDGKRVLFARSTRILLEN